MKTKMILRTLGSVPAPPQSSFARNNKVTILKEGGCNSDQKNNNNNNPIAKAVLGLCACGAVYWKLEENFSVTRVGQRKESIKREGLEPKLPVCLHSRCKGVFRSSKGCS